MIMNYFNDLREHGIEVIQEDTCWIDTFCSYVLKNNLMTPDTLERTLRKTVKVLKEGHTTKDVISLLRRFDIDYTPIDEQYEISLTKWKEILCSLQDNGD